MITPGDPAGIGADILVQVAQAKQSCQLLAAADSDLLRKRAALLKLPIKLLPFDKNRDNQDFTPCPAGTLYVIEPEEKAVALEPGEPCTENAAYILSTLRLAVELCNRGQCHAMVTGPVNKHLICQAGIAFTGHTEFLAQLTQTAQVVMMLASDSLRVALATTHLPLRQVADAITPRGLETTLRIVHEELTRLFAIDKPAIFVCGLNPHAGENGDLGNEEQAIIEPCLEKLRAEGMDLRGPLPADTLFTEKYLRDADAVLAMYHDQGLPVLKAQSFGRAVNITLGLPIIRTSVDHGTAYDLAGSGRADSGSLQEAISSALLMANANTGNC